MTCKQGKLVTSQQNIVHVNLQYRSDKIIQMNDRSTSQNSMAMPIHTV